MTNLQENQQEKRRFHRVNFHSKANLQFGGQTWPTEVIDLCLKGALVSKPEGWQDVSQVHGMLFVHLNDGDTEIAMQVHISHQEEDTIGLACDHIDIDSITHLRRLVELNVGDPSLLERELDALFGSSEP